MIKLLGLLTENDHKVYFQKDTLWYAHSPGSGITAQIKDPLHFKGFITDKKNDDNYDFSADRIIDWSKTEAPVARKGGTSLYKIPYYASYRSTSDGYTPRPGESELSVWGGKIQPDAYVWMLVQKMGSGDTVIGFFKTKQEAIGFWSR